MKPCFDKTTFGRCQGLPVDLAHLRHPSGLEMTVTNRGATLVSLLVPDARGAKADVVLGFDAAEDYEERSQYYGCTVGRYANRIAAAAFELDGVTHVLAANNGRHHLHGGVAGFDKRLWHMEDGGEGDDPAVVFTRTSPDGEEGYPGTLDVRVAYRLRADGVAITCRAVTDRATLVNLTNHSFFNLAGHDAGREAFLRHELMIAADRFLPIDSTCIPSGTPAPVEGTPLDFRMPRTIGARIGDEHPQLENGLGYDHNYVLAGSCATSPRHAATLHDPVSGRTMEVHTTEPGLQWYSGNHLDGRKGKGGAPYEWRGAGCWEAQRFPDTPHHPEYPPAILRPGEIYRQTTLYLFPDLR